MKPLAVLALSSVALVACGQPDTPQAEIAYTDVMADCGIEQVPPLLWGQNVSQSGLTPLEVFDGARNIRVWSTEETVLAMEGEDLSGAAQGPAWIAADTRPAQSFMLYLAEGEASLRMVGDSLQCEPNAQLAAALAARDTLEEQAEAAYQTRLAAEETQNIESEEPAADGEAAQESEES